MKITAIKLDNVRSFQTVPLTELSKSINVFIGANNAGKSTLLYSIYLLQNRNILTEKDIMLGHTQGTIELSYAGNHLNIIPNNIEYKGIEFVLNGGNRNFISTNNFRAGNLDELSNLEPNNLIYPYLSKRKVTNYSETISEVNTNLVSGNFSCLYSKIDRLNTPQFPLYKQYVEACNNILGFEISTITKDSGKRAVYYIDKNNQIPLTSMGEGVANILGLITDLCVAEDRIFIIEEPENDIHPKALKALLKLIIEKSSSNQFFISTHSNIVMKYLGAVPDSKIFNITNDFRDSENPNLFLSQLNEISNNPEERRKVLEDLGYDFFDFDLWKGWLFLEESSAEVFIRDYFIDWFVPSLKGKIRTFSADGSSKIIPKFDDFNKLFVFLHLEPTYKNKVWVIIDGGEEEKQILDKMKEYYCKSGWKESNFNQFKEHDFEMYYPSEFKERVESVVKIVDKYKKREAKKELLNNVKQWINQNESKAKEEFEISAKEVIDLLKSINEQLNKQ
jgi:AAA15 family ATPase/GTPase